MAASDARPIPIKNTAYRVVFPILDADGDLVTGAASLDSEVSKDQGAFADCTNEATEVASASGMYYLDLTASEMNADCVAVIVKTGTAGAKTTTLVFYPQESGDIKVDLQTVAGTAQTAGDLVADTNDIQSRLPAALVSGRIDASIGAVANGAIAAAAFAAGALDAVWSVASRLLTAGTNIVLAKGVGVTGFNDLSAAQVNAEADTALADAGVTTTVTGRIDAAVSTRATPAQVNTEADAALADVGLTSTVTGRIDAAVSSRLATAGYTAPPTAAAVADQVWDEALAGHLGGGSTGAALNAAGSAGDPWSTALPGAYGAGTAGKIVGDNLNATVSSRASQASVDTVDDLLDTEVAAIKADTAAVKLKTDTLPASPAAVGDIPTAVQNADALLGRDLGSGTGAGSLNERTVRAALRFNRNKFTIAGGVLTVYKEDDATVAFTAVITQTPGDPVSASDPA